MPRPIANAIIFVVAVNVAIGGLYWIGSSSRAQDGMRMACGQPFPEMPLQIALGDVERSQPTPTGSLVRIAVRNELPTPAVLEFRAQTGPLSSDRSEGAVRVAIPQGAEAQVDLQRGEQLIDIEVGSPWCQEVFRFEKTTRVTVKPSLTLDHDIRYLSLRMNGQTPSLLAAR